MMWREPPKKLEFGPLMKKIIPTPLTPNVMRPIEKRKRAHRLLSGNRTIDNKIKFSTLRHSFKKICNQKMRENLYNDDDPYLITKKFWSQVKSKNLSHRIPDCMHTDKTYRNKSLEKTELFNNYFYEQFCGTSQYDIDIGWANDASLNILTLQYLKYKSCFLSLILIKLVGRRPDGIHGRILKNCPHSLAQ